MGWQCGIYLSIQFNYFLNVYKGTTQSLPRGELTQEADPMKLWIFSIVCQMFINSIHSFVEERRLEEKQMQ